MLQCSVLQSSVLQHVAAHLILTHTSDTAQRLAGHGTHIKGKISQKSAHYSICHVQGLHSWLLRNFICDVPAGHSTHIKGTHSKFSKVSSIVILSSTFSSEQIVEKFECWACCAHQSYPFKFLKKSTCYSLCDRQCLGGVRVCGAVCAHTRKCACVVVCVLWCVCVRVMVCVCATHFAIGNIYRSGTFEKFHLWCHGAHIKRRLLNISNVSPLRIYYYTMTR